MNRMMVIPVHVTAGLIAIVAGYIAMYALKGAKAHRKSGMVFVYAMLVMAFSASVLSILSGQRFNAAQGVLTSYLVVTALLTVRDRTKESRWVDGAAMLVAASIALYDATLGIEALNSASGTIDGLPPGVVFAFGSIALLSAVSDARMLAFGLKGARRIARHLWRMSFALFVATGSFFLGQMKVMPPSFRIVPLLAIPALLPLVLMLYWLARVLFTKWYRRLPANRFSRRQLASSQEI